MQAATPSSTCKYPDIRPQTNAPGLGLALALGLDFDYGWTMDIWCFSATCADIFGLLIAVCYFICHLLILIFDIESYYTQALN